ncbi:TIGR03751 family conjugal transfer lipoprotein [Azotobacter vinelandii]|uniref:TIGR03751 family conjugal transfer lipoprotein n=1 Tax=Azotobacter vinelandii TaxID=354 RepID=UPI000AC827A3|nr:TIGR03751 family conjugal transfer lipoprotein [Azotobacter vinelandii]
MSFRNLTLASLLGMGLAVSGCSTNVEEMLPHGDQTMADFWQLGSEGGDDLSQQALYDARSELRRPVSDGALVEQRIRYTRTAANEIYNTFGRLPNPDLVMFVFPHLTTGQPEALPVPGYSTVFSLYSRPQYALPGETARPVAPAAQASNGRAR